MSATHFIVRKSTLDKRWDAFYSEPEIVALEQRVQQKATHTLRDFVRFMSGGATPLKSEGDQHYSDAANGVPFIRVQNLTPTGELDLQDVKHITHSTNGSSLARSRLSGGELLVKITGVGRMAVASVVPDGLEANINQHIAAITTESRARSEALAAYLNLDFVERLASRRATGGTRPALDYNALLSIPVIDDPRIVRVMQVAYAEKKQLEAQAAALLSSIDDYFFDELGIALPPPSGKKLFFFTNATKVSGGRFDAPFYEPRSKIWITALNNSTYPIKTLKEISSAIFQGVGQDLTDDALVTLLKVRNIAENNRIDFENVEFVKDVPLQKILCEGDIITPFIGEAIRKIKFSVFPLTKKHYTIDNNTGVIRLKKDVLPDYVASFLATKAGIWQIERLIGGGVPFIGSNNAGKLTIPLPPLEKQTEIADHISAVRTQAKQLQQQAESQLESAKQTVEKLILG